MTLLSAELENPTGYGRVLRKNPKSDEVKAIVEEKAATSQQKKIREINSGFYAFAVKPLYANIGELKTNNAHGEYYLTDMAGVFAKAKGKVVALKTAIPAEILGSNTRAEMMEHRRLMRLREMPRTDGGRRQHLLSADLRDRRRRRGRPPTQSSNLLSSFSAHAHRQRLPHPIL